jgi:Collagen triple helix repeat (20 copies)
MKLKAVVLAGLAVLALAGVAKAAGMIGGHSNPAYDVVEEKTKRLEAKLEAQGDQGATASLARPGRRGPRGPKGARGLRGPKGATGATGPAGPKGTFGAVTSYASAPVLLCSFEAGSCAVGSTKIECPPGTILTGGGYTGAGMVTTVTWSAPVGNSWGVIAVNLDEVPVAGLKAVADCASQ